VPTVTFIERDGSRREVEARKGERVLDAAWRADIDIEGACEGAMACSTCHVVVEEGWYARLPEPTEDEEDMLDLAVAPTRTSRLACQIIVDDAMDGLELRLPMAVGNMMG